MPTSIEEENDMRFPVGPDEVKVVQGRSRGLQVVCSCGCVNFHYLDPEDTEWRCRNCDRVLSYDLPRLIDAAEKLHRQANPVQS